MTLQNDWESRVPAITAISDASLRQSVAATWQTAVEKSEFGGPEDIPQSLHIPARSLLLHTNEVSEMAGLLVTFAQDRYELAIDKDTVLAAAILHDVDKMLAFERMADGTYVYAPGYVVTRDHGPVGAQLALEAGVPTAVAELIRLHSPFGEHEGLPGTPEGTVIHYADLGAADFGAVQVGSHPVHERSRMIAEPRRKLGSEQGEPTYGVQR